MTEDLEFEGSKVEERCLESGRKDRVKSEILGRISEFKGSKVRV